MNPDAFDQSGSEHCVQCGTRKSWRLKLRGSGASFPVNEEDQEECRMSCGHVICVHCGLFYLNAWIGQRKAQIKCPVFQCADFLHENDIRALLDPENTELNGFMPAEIRKQLLFRHDLANVNYAFGGDDNTLHTQQCPRCKNVYAEKIGCNFVRCPDLYCNTWFCWKCGAADINWMHFVVKKCRPQWEDVLKGLYIVTFLLFTDAVTTLFITPPIFLGLFMFCPLVVTVLVPVCMLNWFKRQWLRTGVGQRRDRKMGVGPRSLLIVLFLVLYCLILPISSSLAALILIPISLFWLIYLLFMILKLIPIFGQLMFIIELLQCITGCFGFDDWFKRYKQSKERKEAERVANRQFRKEVYERVPLARGR